MHTFNLKLGYREAVNSFLERSNLYSLSFKSRIERT